MSQILNFLTNFRKNIPTLLDIFNGIAAQSSKKVFHFSSNSY